MKKKTKIILIVVLVVLIILMMIPFRIYKMEDCGGKAYESALIQMYLIPAPVYTAESFAESSCVYEYSIYITLFFGLIPHQGAWLLM